MRFLISPVYDINCIIFVVHIFSMPRCFRSFYSDETWLLVQCMLVKVHIWSFHLIPVIYSTYAKFKKHVNSINCYSFSIDLGPYYWYSPIAVPPGVNILNQLLRVGDRKIAVLQDLLTVLQDFQTWTPLSKSIERECIWRH